MNRKRKRDYQRETGKPVKLPITRKITVAGEERSYSINYGDLSACWRCGNTITATGYNTERFPDRMVYFRCPVCGIKVSALTFWEHRMPRISQDIREKTTVWERRQKYE